MPTAFDDLLVDKPKAKSSGFDDLLTDSPPQEEPVQPLWKTALAAIPRATSTTLINTVGGAAKLLDTGADIAAKYTGTQKGNLFKNIADIADESSQEAERMYPVDPRNPKTGTVFGGIGQAATLLTGGVGGKMAGLGEAALSRIPLAMGAAQGAGEGIDQAKQLGVESPEAQLALGALFGGVEVGTEMLGGIGSKAGTKAIMEAYKKPAEEMLKEAAKDVVSEGAEEIIAGSTQDWLARAFATEDPKNPGFTKTGVKLPEVDPRTKEFLEKRGMEFLGGAAGGALFSGAKVLANAGKPLPPTTEQPAPAPQPEIQEPDYTADIEALEEPALEEVAPPPSIETGEAVIPENMQAAPDAGIPVAENPEEPGGIDPREIPPQAPEEPLPPTPSDIAQTLFPAADPVEIAPVVQEAVEAAPETFANPDTTETQKALVEVMAATPAPEVRGVPVEQEPPAQETPLHPAAGEPTSAEMPSPEKSTQTITGSNVQTGTEMPVPDESTATSPGVAPIPEANETPTQEPEKPAQETGIQAPAEKRDVEARSNEGTPEAQNSLTEAPERGTGVRMETPQNPANADMPNDMATRREIVDLVRKKHKRTDEDEVRLIGLNPTQQPETKKPASTPKQETFIPTSLADYEKQVTAIQNAKKRDSFSPDDTVIMHSPHTGEDVSVSYRGPLGDDKAVVWTGKSQMSVPMEWLRHPNAPAPKKLYTPERAGPSPETANERIPKASVSEVAPPATPAGTEKPMPSTKDGLIEEIIGKKPEHWESLARWKDKHKDLSKQTKAELVSVVEAMREQKKRNDTITDATNVVFPIIKAAAQEAGNKWRTALIQEAKNHGIQDWVTMPDNSLGEESARLARRIAEKQTANGTKPTTPPLATADQTAAKEGASGVSPSTSGSAKESGRPTKTPIDSATSTQSEPVASPKKQSSKPPDEPGTSVPAPKEPAPKPPTEGKNFTTSGGSVGEPGSSLPPAAGGESWLEELFNAPQAEEAQASGGNKLNLSGIASTLRKRVAELRLEAKDWADRKYKKNASQIELRGDGPSRRGSMSVSQINEGKRRRRIEYITSSARNLENLASDLESGKDIRKEIQKAFDIAEKVHRESPSRGTLQEVQQQIVADQILGDKYMTHGDKSAAKILIDAYNAELNTAPKPPSPIAKIQYYKDQISSDEKRVAEIDAAIEDWSSRRYKKTEGTLEIDDKNPANYHGSREINLGQTNERKRAARIKNLEDEKSQLQSKIRADKRELKHLTEQEELRAGKLNQLQEKETLDELIKQAQAANIGTTPEAQGKGTGGTKPDATAARQNTESQPKQPVILGGTGDKGSEGRPAPIAKGDKVSFNSDGLKEGTFLGYKTDGRYSWYEVQVEGEKEPRRVTARNLNDNNPGSVVEGTSYAGVAEKITQAAVNQSTDSTEATDEVIDRNLTPDEKKDAAVELGHKSWTKKAAADFKKSYADWLVTARAATKRLGEIFASLSKNIKRAAMALIAGVSVSTGDASISTSIPYSTIKQAPIFAPAFARPKLDIGSLPGISSGILAERERVSIAPPKPVADFGLKKSAKFGTVKASKPVINTANWIVETGDNKGKPFVVGDKRNGMLYVFDGSGSLKHKAPALYGKSIGDVISQSDMDSPLWERDESVKITPSGRYEARMDEAAPEEKLGRTLTFKEGADADIAIHRLYLGNKPENRPARLASKDAADNRVSFGCVNVSDQVMDDVIDPLFSDSGGVVYILPETSEGKRLFNETVGAPLYQKALPTSRTSMPKEAAIKVLETLGIPSSKVRVIAEPSLDWAGRYNPDGSIDLNAAHLGGKDALLFTLFNHEAVHDALMSGPDGERLARRLEELKDAFTEEELADIQAALSMYEGGSQAELRQEKLVAMVQKLTTNRPDLKTKWGRFVDAVMVAIKRLLGVKNLSRARAELLAAQILARGEQRVRRGKMGGGNATQYSKAPKEQSSLRRDETPPYDTNTTAYPSGPIIETGSGDSASSLPESDNSLRAKAIREGASSIDWQNATRAEKAEAVANFSTKVASSMLDRNPNPNWRIKFRSEAGEPASAGLVGYADGKVLVDFNTNHTSQIDLDGLTAEQSYAAAYDTMQEEFIHAMQHVISASEWIKAGKPGDLVRFTRTRYTKAINEAISKRDAAIKAGNAELAGKIEQAMVDSWNVYHGRQRKVGTLAELVKDLASSPLNPENFFYEMIRQFGQIGRQDFTTESGWREFSGMVAKWIKDAIESLRKALPLARSGEMGEVIKSEIAQLDEMLKHWDSESSLRRDETPPYATNIKSAPPSIEALNKERKAEPVKKGEVKGQVAGEEGIGQIHQKQSTEVAKDAARNVFDGDNLPLDSESIAKFHDVMGELLDPVKGPVKAAEIQAASNDMGPAFVADELGKFALRMAAEKGDVSYFNQLLNNANRMKTGSDDVSSAARVLVARRWSELSRIFGGVNALSDEQKKVAVASGWTQKQIDDLQNEINNAKVEIERLTKELAAIKSSKTGQGAEDVIKDKIKKRKKAVKEKAEAESDEAEKSLEQKTSEAFIKEITERLADPEVYTVEDEEKKKDALNVVKRLASTYKGGETEEALLRERLAELPIDKETQLQLVNALNQNLVANRLIREADTPSRTAQAVVDGYVRRMMPDATVPEENRTKTRIEQALRMDSPTITKQEVFDTLKKNLIANQVPERLADSVAKITADAWQIRRSKKIAEAVDKVDVRWLLQQVLDAPVVSQQSATWRKDMMGGWLSLVGFTPKEVAHAVKVLDAPFAKALADVRIEAAERFAKQLRKTLSLQSNWPAKNKKTFIPALERIQNALRAGSFESVSNEIAGWNGWKPLTAAELTKLNELDKFISEEMGKTRNPDAHQIIRATHDMFNIFKKHVTGNVIENLGIAFHLNLLSGLPTAGVNITGPLVRVAADTAIDMARGAVTLDFGRFKSLAEALKSSFNDYIREGKWAAKNDAYDRKGVTEITTTREIANLNYQLDKWLGGLKEGIKNRDGKAVIKGVFGLSDIVRRFLSVADTAGVAAVSNYALVMGANDMAKKAGISQTNINKAFQAARVAYNDAYNDELLKGYSEDDAHIAAIDARKAAILGFIKENVSPEQAHVLDKRLSRQEGFLAIGRKPLTEDLARNARGEQTTELRDEDLEGGLISRHLFGIAGMNDVMKFISAAKYGGDTPAAKAFRTVAGTLMYGLVHVPYRTSRHFASYSPYGFLRVAAEKIRARKGLDPWYSQSLGTEEQRTNAMWRASAGTALMLLVASLFRGSDEPDDDKDYITVTGNGPPVDDPLVRDAWIKKGNQPYHMRGRLFGVDFDVNIGRGGEVALFSALPFAVMDDLNLRDRGKGYKSKDYKAADAFDVLSTYVAAITQKGGMSGLVDLSGRKTSTLASGKGIADAASNFGSNVIPLNRFIQTTENLFITPPDKSTIETAITGNIPLARLGNLPALNRLGDAVGNPSWLGKISYMGFPLPLAVDPTPQNKKVYEVIQAKMAAPGRLTRPDVEKKYGPLSDKQWYDYIKKTGDYISTRVAERHDRLMQMPADKVDDFMSTIDLAGRKVAAKELGLKPVVR